DVRGVWDLEVTPPYREKLAMRLPAMAGVEAVAAAAHAPLLGGSRTVVIASGRQDRATVRDNYVSAAYFSMLRIPVRRGRVFTEAEAESEAALAVVSESTARRFWPGRDAVGESVTIPPPDPADRSYLVTPRFATARVIGVIGDVRSGIRHGD